MIHILDDHSVDYLPDAYAYSVEDVLRYRQGSCEKPELVESWIREFEQAMNKNDFKTAEIIADKMRRELGEGHTEVKKLADELEFNSWIEEQE